MAAFALSQRWVASAKLGLAMSQAKPLVLFPCEPLNPRQIEPDFEAERQAAKAAGLDTAPV